MGGKKEQKAFLTPASAAIVVATFLTGALTSTLDAQASPSQTPARQAPTATAGKLEFDVTSVKLNKTDDPPNSNVGLGIGDLYSPTGGYFSATGIHLIDYVVFAYKVVHSQVQYLVPQLPSWAANERFDIQARVEGNPTKDEMRLMMQSLLADRFKFAIHHETREVPVFALVLSKPGTLGPQLRHHSESSPCTSEPAPRSPSDSKSGPATVAGGFPVLCGGISGLPPTLPGRVRVGSRNLTMAFISGSNVLMGNLDRPVLDRTGLAGTFDFILEWTPERREAASPGVDSQPDLPSGPTFQQALREQLGLKLESQKGPIDIIVIDHVEHPSEN